MKIQYVPMVFFDSGSLLEIGQSYDTREEAIAFIKSFSEEENFQYGVVDERYVKE